MSHTLDKQITQGKNTMDTKEREEYKRQIQEYLDKGGKITKCEPEARTAEITYKFQRGRKKAQPKEEDSE
jgi:hypothetical protein